MSTTDELLRNNERYADSFNKGDLPMPPAKQIAIVTCMDARLSPYVMLGLSEGDAHVIRNAGGVITDDEIRSLVISQRLLGTRTWPGTPATCGIPSPHPPITPGRRPTHA